MKVRLYSYGGSGLKFLTMHLKSMGIDSYDEKHNPHQSFSDRAVEDDVDRVIYLYSNPIESFLSFWRRTGSDLRWINLHLKHLGSDRQITLPMREYIESAKGFPELSNHFESWYNAEVGVPIVFLRYEDLVLPSVEKELAEFLGFEGDLQIASNFKQRSSSTSATPEGVSKRLDSMFSELIDLQGGLPPFHIKRSMHDQH